MLWHPHDEATTFSSTWSGAVMGSGLKLAPRGFRPSDMSTIENMNTKYIVTNEGLILRDNN